MTADSQDKHGQMPLSLAAWRGHKAMVWLLVEWENVATDTWDKYSQMLLLQVAERGYDTVVQLLTSPKTAS